MQRLWHSVYIMNRIFDIHILTRRECFFVQTNGQTNAFFIKGFTALVLLVYNRCLYLDTPVFIWYVINWFQCESSCKYFMHSHNENKINVHSTGLFDKTSWPKFYSFFLCCFVILTIRIIKLDSPSSRSLEGFCLISVYV